MVGRKCPSELRLNEANLSDTNALFLDLHLSMSDGFVRAGAYDKRDGFDFDVVSFQFLYGDVPRSTSYVLCLCFSTYSIARVSSHVGGFSARNKVLTAKLLRQGYSCHRLRKAFSKFYLRHFDMVSRCGVGLKALLLQGLLEPGFCGDLVCGFGGMFGEGDFPCRLGRVIVRCGGVGCGMDVLRRTACLVVNPIKVSSFANLLNCTTVGRASD